MDLSSLKGQFTYVFPNLNNLLSSVEPKEDILKNVSVVVLFFVCLFVFCFIQWWYSMGSKAVFGFWLPLNGQKQVTKAGRFGGTKKSVELWNFFCVCVCVCVCVYMGAGHIIRISSKSWFISLIPFKKWNLYNVYIHSTQTDIFQVFISFNFDDYKWQLMKTPNSVSQKIRILWKGSILKTPGATL